MTIRISSKRKNLTGSRNNVFYTTINSTPNELNGQISTLGFPIKKWWSSNQPDYFDNKKFGYLEGYRIIL